MVINTFNLTEDGLKGGHSA